MDNFDKLIEALKKKALGNVVEQTIENYNGSTLESKTIKRVKNDIDTQACIKLIDIELKKRELEKDRDIYNNMTDTELLAEREKLRKQLEEP